MTPHCHRCGFCKRRLPTAKGLRLHTQNSPRCRRKWEAQAARIARRILRVSRETDVSPRLPDSNVDDPSSLPPSTEPLPDIDDPMDGAPSRSAQVSDVPEDEELAYRYVEDYPGVVAEIIREDKTLFEKWSQMREEAGVDEWAPFQDQGEWELFRWLIKHVGQNAIDDFLKLSIVSQIGN